MQFLTDDTESRAELCAALVVFQSAIGSIPKSSENPFFRSKYADMAAVMEHIRPALIEAKLSIIQTYIEADLEKSSGQPMIETRVMHSSGQGFTSLTPCVLAYQWNKDAQEYRLEMGPQAAGKSQTYARRYGLMAALCLAAGGDDDDGESGQQPFRSGTASEHGSADDHGVRKMSSRFNNKCPMCGKDFKVGDPIAWKKGKPGAHWACYESWLNEGGDSQHPADELHEHPDEEGTSDEDS